MIAPSASAQFEVDPNGVIDGEVAGEGMDNTLKVLAYLGGELGDPTGMKLTPLGPASAAPSPCPPAGTYLDTPDYPVEIEVAVIADAVTDEGEVEVYVTYCMVLSNNPCVVQCFELWLFWEPISYQTAFETFISDPPPPEPSGPGGYSFQFVRTGECLAIQIVVTPWGQVMSGEAFAAQYPELIAGVITGLAGRLSQPFDPSCVTWTKS